MTLDAVLQEGLATFEAFRRLRFPSEEIYLALNGPLEEPQHVRGKTQVSIVLRHAGKEFTVCIGFVDDAPKTVQAAWTTAGDAWNNGTEAHRDAIWRASHVRNNSVHFVTGLVQRGFSLARDTYPL